MQFTNIGSSLVLNALIKTATCSIILLPPEQTIKPIS